jgi:hypothetical protein
VVAWHFRNRGAIPTAELEMGNRDHCEIAVNAYLTKKSAV